MDFQSISQSLIKTNDFTISALAPNMERLIVVHIATGEQDCLSDVDPILLIIGHILNYEREGVLIFEADVYRLQENAEWKRLKALAKVESEKSASSIRAVYDKDYTI